MYLLFSITIAFLVVFVSSITPTPKVEHQYIKYKSVSNHNDCSISHKCGSSMLFERSSTIEMEKETAPCEVANLILVPENIEDAHGLLDNVSSRDLVHKIIIEAVDVKDVTVGNAIDKFLSVNSWWVIRKEVYNFNGKVSGRIVDGTNYLNSNAKHMIVLVRYKHMYEEELRLISGMQNPPTQDICDNTTLYVARMINSGWGSIADMIISNMGLHRSSIFNIWYSVYNQPDESFAMIHYKDCKEGLINKWECLFLPLTNCSMKNVEFTKCHKEGCFSEDFFKVRNMGADGGEMISGDSPWGSGNIPQNNYQMNLLRIFKNDHCDELQRAPFLTAQNENIMYSLPAREVFDGFALTFRPNYNLRHRLAIAIREAEDSKMIPFSASKTLCVAIHIRRGDRAIKGLNGVDMKRFCDRFTREAHIVRDNCTDELLAEVYAKYKSEYADVAHWGCEWLVDFGCFGVASYGELTLVDYLQKGKALLPTVKHAFVMTDDGEWLDEEIKHLPSQTSSGVSDWIIGKWPQGENDRVDNEARNGTIAAINFWGAVEVSRQCNAFVGHFGSAVAHFVHRAMCFQHNVFTGTCPPAADIGWGSVHEKETDDA